MLVLSRKPGERILIGNDVKITVIRIGPNSVRIGIDAPGHLNIVREELCLNDKHAALAYAMSLARAPSDWQLPPGRQLQVLRSIFNQPRIHE